MKKITKIILVLTVTFLLTGCVDKNSDAYKFKKEYESINNEKNSKGKKYRSLSIPEDNPFVYATAEDIVKKINKKETFVVYFGFKDCPWCRSVVEQLIKVAKDKKIDKIYYVDVKDIRDEKEVGENGEIITKKEGNKYYMDLTELLSNVLEDYSLTKDELKIFINEKRIYAPNVIAIGNGEAIQMETGIPEDLKDPYDTLTDKMKTYTYNKFKCVLECVEEASTTCQKDKC